MIRHIHHKAMMDGLTNLNPVIIKPDEPQVPGDADVVFVCDVLHHVNGREAWLKRVAAEMKPGARFVLIEFKEGKLPEGPPESAKIPRKRLVELVTQAGLQYESDHPELLPYQVFLVFRKGATATGAVERARGETQAVAYYFHGTVRCETCLKIEKEARDIISGRFAGEMASGRLLFTAVNYDLPENAHFWRDYKLPCPSLVLVRKQHGSDQDWKLLGQTWELVQIPPRLHQYIEEEVTKFLEGEAESAATREPAEAAIATTVASFSEVESLAEEMNATFVFLPEKGRMPTASALAAVNQARRTLEGRFDIKVGLFSLAPGSRDYEEMCAKTKAPVVVAVVKTGATKAIGGELTEEKVVDGFMSAVAAGGCCPLGYPGEK